MRVWCCHTTTEFLTKQIPPNVKGNHPTMKVEFLFCLRNGQTRPLKERWGLVDSGAGMTAMPAYLIGLYERQYPMDLSDPIAVKLTGLHASRVVPSYLTILSVCGQSLNGPWCPSCGVSLIGRRCPECLNTPEKGAFLVAAVRDLAFPIIGRDVWNKFLAVIDPFHQNNEEKHTMFANGKDGKAFAWSLKRLRGHSLCP